MSVGQYYLDVLKGVIIPIIIIYSSVHVAIRLFRNEEFNYKNILMNVCNRVFINIILLCLLITVWLGNSSNNKVFMEQINIIISPEHSLDKYNEIFFIIFMSVVTLLIMNIIVKMIHLFWYGILAIYRIKAKKTVEMLNYSCECHLLNSCNKPDVGVKAKVIDESGVDVANLVSDSWGKFYFRLPKGKYKLVFEASESGIDRPDETIYAGSGIRKLLDSCKETMQIIIHKLKNKK